LGEGLRSEAQPKAEHCFIIVFLFSPFFLPFFSLFSPYARSALPAFSDMRGNFMRGVIALRLDYFAA
jgi:hypothetical protein